MRVTYLAHSGFLVELPSVTLLFDWSTPISSPWITGGGRSGFS